MTMSLVISIVEGDQPMTHLNLQTWRRDLHQIPELGFDLFQTHNYVKKVLEGMGYDTMTYAKTGLVAIRKGESERAYAFRSDMDALPVLEETNQPFASTHAGVMHACGHDGHMAMLLGFARYVSQIETVNDTIVILFQPAEEGPGGAKVVIDEGLFSKYPIKAIFGLHLYPGLQKGTIGFRQGPMLARNGEFDTRILGRSGHAATPHLAVDAIVVAGHLITEYHQIVSRSLNPLKPAVVTIGTIQGGEARNIIAKNVSISGTIRAFDDRVYQDIKDRMRAIDKGLELAHGVTIMSDVKDYYPVVDNDPELCEVIASTLEKSDVTDLEPMMFAEDFAFYQQIVPGVFAMLGVRDETKGMVYPLHSNRFDFDEDVLERGVSYYIGIAKAFKML